ncbi:hypothetical protein [Corynebacterium sp. HMSC11D10]|nr:hypothetical protein [Corynebacterium sp. HMSC11D10]
MVDPDAQRLRWVERQAGVYDNDDDHDDEEQETPDWIATSS